MRILFQCFRGAGTFLFPLLLLSGLQAQTSNVTIRVMSANLNGNTQNYQPFAIRIFQGLKPDIVAIQEFNYNSTNGLGNNTPAAFREMLDTAFGTEFVYSRETNNYNIPNGVISRYPITASGEWTDSFVPDRGFAWARIDLPGTNDLYVVSVHLYSSGTATDRNSEATTVKTQIQNAFPANAWVIVAGDFNTSSRSEAVISTFSSFLSDFPIPTDAESGGDADTNEPRSKPYDYVLPSFSLATFLTNVVLASHSFSNGLVFDSQVYSPLSDVAPVLSGDSHMAQHMAVLKAFSVPSSTNSPATNPPSITVQPQGQTVAMGGNAIFSVTATGSPTLIYQWRLDGTNIGGAIASSYTKTNVQPADAGPYTVFITNDSGSITSSVANLTVTNPPPAILTQPQSLTVAPGQNAPFTVTATGASLTYQWRFNGTNIPNATSSTYTVTNAQTSDAGSYLVAVSNSISSVTSSIATLTIQTVSSSVIAQWNFNSNPADANTATGTTSPSSGTGTAALVGGVSQAFFGGSSTDPAPTTDNSGWSTTTYPAQGTANKTAGVRFNVSTLGRQNISIRWDYRASNTGSKYARLQYSTNGTTFTDFPAVTVVGVATAFEPRTNNLASFPGVSDNPSFAFRIVAELESTAITNANANYVGANGTYAPTTGTVRFDMVTVSGTIIPPPAPAGPASLIAPVYDPSQFQFTVTGTAGSNYVIQAATDLAAPSWTPLRTNPSPFLFVDPAANSYTQRFYRAVSAP